MFRHNIGHHRALISRGNRVVRVRRRSCLYNVARRRADRTGEGARNTLEIPGQSGHTCRMKRLPAATSASSALRRSTSPGSTSGGSIYSKDPNKCNLRHLPLLVHVPDDLSHLMWCEISSVKSFGSGWGSLYLELGLDVHQPLLIAPPHHRQRRQHYNHHGGIKKRRQSEGEQRVGGKPQQRCPQTSKNMKPH